MAVFARLNKGYKMPYFDDFRDNFDSYTGGEMLIKEVSQAELGYKYMGDEIQAFATLFSNEVKGDTFVRLPGEPAEILTNQATGMEFDLGYFTNDGLSISLNATLQDSEITASAENQGNETQRQPGWQIRVTPSYDFDLGDNGFVTLYGTFSAVDDRFGNNANTVVLPGYEKIDVGVIYEPNEQIQVQLSIDNLTDELGITEGDPRDPTAPNGRYILPRSIKLSLSYQLF